jgi:hypothetical protein
MIILSLENAAEKSWEDGNGGKREWKRLWEYVCYYSFAKWCSDVPYFWMS